MLPFTRAECEAAIERLDGITLTQARFLFLLLTLSRLKGYCWMQQEQMALHLRVSLRTIETLVAWAKRAGFLAEVERVGFFERRYHLDLVRLGMAAGPVPADAVGRTRSDCGHISDPRWDPRDGTRQAAAGTCPVERTEPPAPAAASSTSSPREGEGYDETPRSVEAPPEPQARVDVSQPADRGTLYEDLEKVADRLEATEAMGAPSRERDPTRPSWSGTARASSREGALRPGPKKAEPFEAEPSLLHKTRTLQGGDAAIDLLQRKRLPREINNRVLYRVIEYDKQVGGLDNAAKFIHGPIRDANSWWVQHCERLHHERKRTELAEAYLNKRIDTPPSDVPIIYAVPRVEPGESAMRFAAQFAELQRLKGNDVPPDLAALVQTG